MDFKLMNGHTVYNLTSSNSRLLDLLITDKSGADQFTFEFLAECTNENEAVGDYREFKILQKNLSFNDFIADYCQNKEQALTSLFMHPVMNHEVNLLTEMIASGKITLETVFTRHKKEPRAKLIRHLL